MQLLLPCFVVCLSQAHCIRKRKSCGSVFITICAGCRTGMGIRMNAAMKEQHFSRINDERARRVYDYLCASCELREGGLTDADQMLVYDYAYAEQVKQQLQDDIKARGIGREYTNGRQKYWQDNKSVPQLRAYCDQQRKTLAELRLTPTSRKAAALDLDDDFATY